jgi:hypothetical protein
VRCCGTRYENLTPYLGRIAITPMTAPSDGHRSPTRRLDISIVDSPVPVPAKVAKIWLSDNVENVVGCADSGVRALARSAGTWE